MSGQEVSKSADKLIRLLVLLFLFLMKSWTQEVTGLLESSTVTQQEDRRALSGLRQANYVLLRLLFCVNG